MSLRLLIDMNLSPDWVPVLQEAGFDAALLHRRTVPYSVP